MVPSSAVKLFHHLGSYIVLNVARRHLFTPFLNGLVRPSTMGIRFLALLSFFFQRRDGADMNTIIRLTKFHELNVCTTFWCIWVWQLNHRPALVNPHRLSPSLCGTSLPLVNRWHSAPPPRQRECVCSPTCRCFIRTLIASPFLYCQICIWYVFGISWKCEQGIDKRFKKNSFPCLPGLALLCRPE